MNRLAWLLPSILLALAGCAQAPSTSSSSAQSGKDTQRMEAENPRARIHTELAAHYYARRQHAVALQELREALLADGSYAPAFNVFGLVHAALLEDKEAEANFRRALDLAPQYSEAHNNYAVYLCSRQRRAEAMEHFEAAWKNPLYANPERALANAGQCALRNGDLAEAERFAQRALIRAENQPQALATMAEVHYQRGNLVSARTLVRQLEGQGGLDAGSLWLAVRLERKSGSRDAEASYGLQLRRSYPDAQETTWLMNGRYDMPGERR
jgi:type IV pilus assembly protein PilF